MQTVEFRWVETRKGAAHETAAILKRKGYLADAQESPGELEPGRVYTNAHGREVMAARSEAEKGFTSGELDVSKEKLIKSWQREYDAAVKGGGVVENIAAEIGRMGGLAIWLTVRKGGKVVYYSPFYDQDPQADDLEAVEKDADLWLWMMLGATDWANHDWGKPEIRIPAY